MAGLFSHREIRALLAAAMVSAWAVGYGASVGRGLGWDRPAENSMWGEPTRQALQPGRSRRPGPSTTPGFFDPFNTTSGRVFDDTPAFDTLLADGLLFDLPAELVETSDEEVFPDPQVASRLDVAEPAPRADDREAHRWKMLPQGLIYRSYFAGVKEPRFASQWVHEVDEGWLWDVTLGGRVGLVRYGTPDPVRPEGWQLDMEGAAMPRLDMEESLDVIAVDFRFGLPLTYGRGRYQTKLGYYHLSSHLGDEFMIKNPNVPRINYSRDAIIWGHSYDWAEDVRLYGEATWAFQTSGGADPLEFQFGVDFAPRKSTGRRLVPFFAANGHLREEVSFGGSLTLQTGWMWRGDAGEAFRFGFHYFNGKSDQFEFFNRYENKTGMGVWYDY